MHIEKPIIALKWAAELVGGTCAMSKAKRTVRIIANRDGMNQNILTIRESGTASNLNGLLIAQPTGKFYEDYLTGRSYPCNGITTSIHVSPNAVGHNIIDHVSGPGVERAVAERFKTAAYVVLSESRPVWLVSTHIFSLPRTRDEHARIRKGDEVLHVPGGGVDQSLCALVWLSRIDFPLVKDRINCLQIDFTVFRIYIDIHWLTVPPMPQGFRSFSATSSREEYGVSDGKVEAQEFDGATPTGANQLEEYSLSRVALGSFRNAARQLMIENMRDEDVWRSLPEICCHATWTTDGQIDAYQIADPRGLIAAVVSEARMKPGAMPFFRWPK